MKRSPTPTSRTATATTLALGFILLLFFAMPGTAQADNQGTIKVHNPDSLEDEANDPHVACSFFIEGFNMEATSGTLVIKSWEPTGNMSVVVNTTWSADDDEDEGHHFVNGPYSLPDGHYKVFVSDTQHDKMKTFWVECDPECETDCETTTTTTTSTTTTGPPPTTEVPFFTSGTALALGVAGSLAGAFVLLRRRL